jgi:hypothetical protein
LTLKRRKRVYSRSAMLEFLRGLTAVPRGDALTLYLPPRLTPGETETLLEELPAARDIDPGLNKIITASPTGSVVFWSPVVKYAVLPPFPVPEKRIILAIATGPLEDWLRQEFLIALVLVRLGSYGIGVYRGEKHIGSKVGTGLVHGRHRQGGSSAHRFERHRDKQIESFLTRVCRHAREQIEPYARSLDYIVYGGARTTILLLQKQCPLLGNLKTPALPPLLDIPEPRQPVLEDAVTRVGSSTVFEWRED